MVREIEEGLDGALVGVGGLGCFVFIDRSCGENGWRDSYWGRVVGWGLYRERGGLDIEGI